MLGILRECGISQLPNINIDLLKREWEKTELEVLSQVWKCKGACEIRISGVTK